MRRNETQRTEDIGKLLVFLSDMAGRAVWLTAPRVAEYLGYKNVDFVRSHLWKMFHDGMLVAERRKGDMVLQFPENGATTHFAANEILAQDLKGQLRLALYFPDGERSGMDIPYMGNLG